MQKPIKILNSMQTPKTKSSNRHIFRSLSRLQSYHLWLTLYLPRSLQYLFSVFKFKIPKNKKGLSEGSLLDW